MYRRFFGRLGQGGWFARGFLRGAIVLLLLAASLLGLLLDQPLPVGDGDLIVVRMDFAEGKEAVPVAAVFDEGGLEAGLYPNHLGEVDVALELALGRCLDIEILQPATVQHHDAGLFRVRGIDQHTLGHLVLNSDRPPRDATRIPVGCAPAGGGIGV